MIIFLIAFVLSLLANQQIFPDWHFMAHAMLSAIMAWVAFVLIDDHLNQRY